MIFNLLKASNRRAIQKSIFFIAISSLISQSAFAEFIFSGQNRLTLENYSVSGDKNNGLYQFEGNQAYDDLNINFSEQYSGYHSMRGYFLANSNRSDYRGEYQSQLTNASVTIENGESSTPYRLELGDYFANQSRHTLQRGIKGIQLEFQPQSINSPSSFQFFLGRSAADYKELFNDDNKHYFLGGSWLAELNSLGSFALTSVDYHSNDINGDKRENVSSVSWFKEFKNTSFTHLAEVEFSYLTGENTQTNSLSGQSQFLKFSGYDASGYNYLINVERNDDEFSPFGAAVTADRETIDLQWGQPISEAINFRVRSQRYKDNFNSNNVSTSQVNGINFNAFIFNKENSVFNKLNLNLDYYQQDDSDDTQSFDRTSQSLQLNLSLPINPQIRTQLSYQNYQSDNNLSNLLSKRQSLSLGLGYSFIAERWNLNLSPTLRYSKNNNVRAKTSSSSLGWLFNASKNGHTIFFSHQLADFNNNNVLAIDSNTAQTRLEWQKNWKQHGFTLAFDNYNLDPDGSAESDSYKSMLTWVYRFDKSTFNAPQNIRLPLTIASFSSLDDLTLGARFAAQEKLLLNTAHFSFIGNTGSFQLFDGKLFSNIKNRQVIAVKTNIGHIESANLLIPINSNPALAKATFQRFLNELLNTYGKPTLSIEREAFTANWVSQLQQNKFSRIFEWITKNGILRMGIPKPKTGQLRIEMQLRSQQPSATSNDWGLSLVL